MSKRNSEYLILFLLALTLLLPACSPRHPKLIRTGPSYLGYLLIPDRPIPTNPQKAAKYDFEYVGVVEDGTECLVFGMAELEGERFYEIMCEGFKAPGFIPADLVKVIEYY